jgi:hypothetical protein
MKKQALAITLALSSLFCGYTNAQKKSSPKKETTPFIWEGANLYFLLTDRFNDDNNKKEIYFDRTKTTGKLRGFEGGNIHSFYKHNILLLIQLLPIYFSKINSILPQPAFTVFYLPSCVY